MTQNIPPFCCCSRIFKDCNCKNCHLVKRVWRKVWSGFLFPLIISYLYCCLFYVISLCTFFFTSCLQTYSVFSCCYIPTLIRLLNNISVFSKHMAAQIQFPFHIYTVAKILFLYHSLNSITLLILLSTYLKTLCNILPFLSGSSCFRPIQVIAAFKFPGSRSMILCYRISHKFCRR